MKMKIKSKGFIMNYISQLPDFIVYEFGAIEGGGAYFNNAMIEMCGRTVDCKLYAKDYQRDVYNYTDLTTPSDDGEWDWPSWAVEVVNE